MSLRKTVLGASVLGLLLVSPLARATDEIAPPPPSDAVDATNGAAADLAWAQKVKGHRRDGVLGFAATYGAAAVVGGALTGLMLLHERNNPRDDIRPFIYGVSLPMLVPVVGPLYLGTAVAGVTTWSLATTHGAESVVGFAVAPLAYGFAALCIADGVAQALFFGQAVGWRDPDRRAPSTAASVSRRFQPLILPEVRTAGSSPSMSQRTLPTAVGIELHGLW